MRDTEHGDFQDGTPSRPMPLDGIDRRDPGSAATIADLDAMAKNVQRHLSTGDMRLGALESQLRLNTEMTADTKALLEGVAFGMKVIGFLGKAAIWLRNIAGAIAALYGLWLLITRGPPRP